MTTPRFARRPTTAGLLVAADVAADSAPLHSFARTRGDGRFTLESLVGAGEIAAIIASGSLEFTAVGDTGKGDNTPQSEVIEAMAKDLRPDDPAAGATFFLHLGDIIYGPGKESLYANKFYRPNMAWLKPVPDFQGIVLAIPGNHDGEVRDPRDSPSLEAFIANFCTDSPTMAASFGIKMPNQPGPYWWLDAPFLDLIGLYSSSGEDAGFLNADDGDQHQLEWLKATLQTIAQQRSAGAGDRKALVFATHHTPFNQGLDPDNRKGHPPSPEMLAQIDAACAQAGIWPDLHLSGHSHQFQRYMRTVTLPDGRDVVIPYYIVGTGGIGSDAVPFNIGKVDTKQRVKYANALGRTGPHDEVYGYLRIKASSQAIQATFVRTFSNHRNEFETVAIDLATGRETAPVF